MGRRANETNCKILLMRMARYIDGELERDLCKVLENHLKGCDRCRIVFDTRTNTTKLFKDLQWVPIPPQVRRRLPQSLRERRKIMGNP
ncbi:MAG: anti-sigma factor family protein [Terriglobia bacterium]